MKPFTILFSVALVISLSLISAGCLLSEPELITPEQGDPLPSTQYYTSNETLVAFVESAVAYVGKHGKEAALAEFNDPNGAFIQGELYIYAYDFNGTTLAHPIDPEKVGANRLNEAEGGVGMFLTEMNAAIREGENFHRIAYINPTHDRRLESKLTYAVQAGDDWWLGSGIYTGPADPSLVAPAE